MVVNKYKQTNIKKQNKGFVSNLAM